MSERDITASIVIPTYRRHDLLQRCLWAVCDQSVPADQYEVVVADDACNPETERLVSNWAETGNIVLKKACCKVRYVAVGPGHGPAAARNCGWRAARGEILAFTDDDCVPDKHWLATGVQHLNNESSSAAAWGRLEMPLPASPTDYQRDAAGLASAVFVTANCFVRRAALFAVGGFDERFRVAWREDSDLYYSLLERNYVVTHLPAALVQHPIRPAPWGVSLAQQNKSRFDVLLFRKHPQLYQQHVPHFPMHYCFNVFTGLSGLIAVLCLQWIWAIAMGGLWLLLTFRFTLLRLRGTSHAPGHVVEMLATSALIPWLAVYHRLAGLWQFRGIMRNCSLPSPRFGQRGWG